MGGGGGYAAAQGVTFENITANVQEVHMSQAVLKKNQRAFRVLSEMRDKKCRIRLYKIEKSIKF